MSGDRTLIACFTVAATVGTFAPSPIRIVAGLALAFFLPGRALQELLLLPKPTHRAERLFLAIGISTTATVLTGLLLVGVGGQVSKAFWAFGLGAVTLIALAVASVLSEIEENSVTQHAWRLPSVDVAVLWPILIAGAMCASAIAFSVRDQRDAQANGFTELAATRAKHLTRPAVALHVRSHELSQVQYRLRMSIGGRVRVTRRISVEPGKSWHETVIVPDPKLEVVVTLVPSRGGPTYRRVRLAPV